MALGDRKEGKLVMQVVELCGYGDSSYIWDNLIDSQPSFSGGKVIKQHIHYVHTLVMMVFLRKCTQAIYTIYRYIGLIPISYGIVSWSPRVLGCG